MEILSRRIEGVNVAKVDGSIPGWPAYDAKHIFGLDPKQAYAWSARPRDLSAPHLASLPNGVVLEQAGVHADFARFRFRKLNAAGEIALWDFRGEVRTGVRFADGTTRTGDALDFTDEPSGGTVHPEQDGLFLHPPWRGERSLEGRPVTFIEFVLRLPRARHVGFQADVHLREAAVGKSDGVTFRVLAWRGHRKRSAETHHDGAQPKPLRLDLTEFAGEKVRLRLEVDAGPKNETSFDWALVTRPRVVTRVDASAETGAIRFAGLNAAPLALAGTNPVPVRVERNGAAKVEIPLPGTLVLAFAEPIPVTAPCDLLETRFTRHLVSPNGLETVAESAFAVQVANVRRGEEERAVLSLSPPPAGCALADWLVQLPAAPVRLLTSIAPGAGARTRGARFEVQVNGETQVTRTLGPDGGESPVEVDLTPWRGQPVLLTLRTVAEGPSPPAPALWFAPRLVAAGE
jgi:hypothetical protein